MLGLAAAGALAGQLPRLPALDFWLALAPIQIAPLLAVLIVARQRLPAGERVSAFELSSKGLKAIFRILPKAFLFCIGLHLAASAVVMATAMTLMFFGYEPSPMPILEILLESPTVLLAVSVIVGAVIIAPFSEEILFRLVLFDALRPAGEKRAAVMTAAIFAVVHGSLLHIPALFFLGLVLQRLRLRSGSLWHPILAHMLFNGLTFLYLGLMLLFHEDALS